MQRLSGALLLGEYKEWEAGRLENREEYKVSQSTRGEEGTGSEKSDKLLSNWDIVVSII